MAVREYKYNKISRFLYKSTEREITSTMYTNGYKYGNSNIKSSIQNS